MQKVFLAAVVSLSSLPGCYGYAPPIRAGFDGMPESVRAGGGSVAAQYGIGGGFTGDARVGIGVGHGMRVTLGGTAAQGLFGNVGLRAHIIDEGVLSLELGADLGLGAGGQESNLPDDDPNAEAENESNNNDELVIGGAFDVTLGFRAHRYAGFYLPIRVQVSASPDNELVPTTLYHQVGFGWQADWTRTLFTRLDAGYFGVSTLESTGRDDPRTEFGWTANVGFGARWGGTEED